MPFFFIEDKPSTHPQFLETARSLTTSQSNLKLATCLKINNLNGLKTPYRAKARSRCVPSGACPRSSWRRPVESAGASEATRNRPAPRICRDPALDRLNGRSAVPVIMPCPRSEGRLFHACPTVRPWIRLEASMKIPNDSMKSNHFFSCVHSHKILEMQEVNAASTSEFRLPDHNE
jgi:hypothetical protein